MLCENDVRLLFTYRLEFKHFAHLLTRGGFLLTEHGRTEPRTVYAFFSVAVKRISSKFERRQCRHAVDHFEVAKNKYLNA